MFNNFIYSRNKKWMQRRDTVNARLMYPPWYIRILHIGLEYFNEFTGLIQLEFSTNFYNLMRSTRIIKDNRIYWFIPVDNGGQSRRKLLFCAFFLLWHMTRSHVNLVTMMEIKFNLKKNTIHCKQNFKVNIS